MSTKRPKNIPPQVLPFGGGMNLPVDENGKIIPRRGRDKGVQNTYTKTLKHALMLSFEKVGGVKYLERIANEHPKIYCMMLSRLMPTTVATVDSEGGEGPLQIQVVYKKPDPKVIETEEPAIDTEVIE